MSLTDPEPDFASHDGVLHALLGLLAASRQIEEGISATGTLPGDIESAEPHDDPVLHALLGVLALRGHVSRVVEAWANEAASPPPLASTRPAPTPLEGLLR